MIKIKKVNEVLVYIDADRGILQEISDRFSFYAANYQHMPKFKNKIWDGKIRLFNSVQHTLPLGLTEDLIEFLRMSGYEFELDPGILVKRNITIEQVNSFIDTLNIPSNMKPRHYQVEALQHALSRQKSGFLSPTSSGKSMIIYMIVRFMLSHEKETLIVVPTINLVQQMNGDFADYNHNKFLDTHLISEGADKKIKKPVTISTWQSIKNMPKEWFDRFDCIIIDEVHGSEAKELSGILGKMDQTKYRFGFTGTMRDTISNEMTLTGHFGKFKVVTTLEELEAAGFISKLNIKVTILKYSDAEKKHVRSLKNSKQTNTKQQKGAKAYADEMAFIDAHEKRNEFIVKYANSLSGNVLILFKRVDKHVKILYDLLKKGCPDADVRFVAGTVGVDAREEIRKLVDSSKKKVIIVGSLGTMSTGANMKKLRHIMFVSSTKANIPVMQSIGRGLRLDGGDNLITLHDLSDDFRSGHFTNSAMKHLIARIEMYDKEGFEYEILSYKLQ